MSDYTTTINIPLDDDGFLTLSCPYCKNNFKLIGSELENSEKSDLYCPLCGLINEMNTFYTKEFYNKTEAIATNVVENEIYNMFKNLEKQTKSNKSFSIKAGKKPINYEPELYEYNDEKIIVQKKCCRNHVKINKLDEQLSIFCPYCGEK